MKLIDREPTLEMLEARDMFMRLFKYVDGHLIWENPTCRKIKKGAVAGTKTVNGYIQVSVKGKVHFAHRIIFLMQYGWWPEEIDHIDCDKTNNKIENLREATRSQNAANRRKQSNNSTGYKGIYYSKHHNGFVARFFSDNKTKFIGSFRTAEEAHSAYLTEHQKHFKEFARND